MTYLLDSRSRAKLTRLFTGMSRILLWYVCGVVSRFGWRVAFGDVNGDSRDDLAVSAPFLSTSWALTAAEHNTGGVYVYLAGASFPTGKVTSAESKAQWSVSGATQGGRLGNTILPVNVTVPVTKGYQLAVAAPYSNTAAPMAGYVSLFQVA